MLPAAVDFLDLTKCSPNSWEQIDGVLLEVAQSTLKILLKLVGTMVKNMLEL